MDILNGESRRLIYPTDFLHCTPVMWFHPVNQSGAGPVQYLLAMFAKNGTLFTKKVSMHRSTKCCWTKSSNVLHNVFDKPRRTQMYHL